jgi:hypothetical protein
MGRVDDINHKENPHSTIQLEVNTESAASCFSPSTIDSAPLMR